MTQSAQSANAPRSAPLMAALDSLLAAPGACKNFRAISLMGMTWVAAMVLFSVFTFLAAKAGSPAIGGIGALLAFFVGFYGANAVGILMMQEAQEQPSGSMVDALMLSLFSSHRLLVVLVLELLIVAAALIVIAVVLFICKIPVLGTMLFAVVLPVSAVLLGVLVFSLFYVMLPLAGPAVWSGSTVFQVVAQLHTIARKKLLPVITQQLILFVIVFFVSGIIFSIVMIGFMMASGLSASIIGAGGMHMGQSLSSFSNQSGGSGYMIAGSIGSGVLFALAAVIPGLIMMKGICIIYLNSTQGLDFSQAEAELASGMASVKKKAEEARERARQLAERAERHANNAKAAVVPDKPVPEEPNKPTPEEPACPSCQSPVAADDAFCGNCGHKLK